MNRELARQHFEQKTEEFGLEHTFPFDEAWDFVEYKRLVKSLKEPYSFIKMAMDRDGFRSLIKQAEEKISAMTESYTGDNVNLMNPLRHSFGDGCYVREIFNPAGAIIVTKIHKKDHPFFLLHGDMSVFTEDGEKRIMAPHYNMTPAGTKRIIFCHSDCVFVTVHQTRFSDLKDIENDIIAKDFEEVDL